MRSATARMMQAEGFLLPSRVPRRPPSGGRRRLGTRPRRVYHAITDRWSGAGRANEKE